MKFCINCGKPLPPGAVFCGECGVRLTVEQPQTSQPQQTHPQQPPQPRPSYPQQPAQPRPSYPQQPTQPQPSYPQQPAQPQPSYPQQPTQPQPSYPQQLPQSPQPFAGEVVKQAAKKGLGAGAKWLIAILITVVVAGAMVAVFVFTDLGEIFKDDETLIRERIQAYEDACNNGDYEAMLDCMDGSTRSMMEATMGLMDGLFSEGIGMDIGMTDLFGFAGMMGDYCDIEITNIEIDGDYATVDIVMSMEMYGMEEQSQEGQLPMVKEDGDWYIGGLDNYVDSALATQGE